MNAGPSLLMSALAMTVIVGALLGTLRGRDYDVTYLGYNADGRIGRLDAFARAHSPSNRHAICTDRRDDVCG